jgi:hypothetical protein
VARVAPASDAALAIAVDTAPIPPSTYLATSSDQHSFTPYTEVKFLDVKYLHGSSYMVHAGI